jgi:hypothetical protein
MWPGVTAVLTESSTDVLSHVAIRARSQGVLLATLYDDDEWNRLTALQARGCVCPLLTEQDLLCEPLKMAAFDKAWVLRAHSWCH